MPNPALLPPDLSAGFAADLPDGRMSFAALVAARQPQGGTLLPQNRARLQRLYRGARVQYGQPLTLEQYRAGTQALWADSTRGSASPMLLAALAVGAFWYMSQRRGR